MIAATVLLGILEASCTAATSIHFLTTPRTPEFISRLITDFFQPASFISAEQRSADPAALVLDYSYDEVVSHFAQSERTIAMWHSGQAFCTRYCNYGTKFTHYLQQLNFTEVVLIADAGDSTVEICKQLLDTYPSVYSEVITIPHPPDPAYLLKLVGQVIKPSGNNLFALFTDELSTWHLLQAFESKRLMKEGFAYVLSARASYFQQFGTLFEGLLYVAPAVSALAHSAEDAEKMKLAAVAQWYQETDMSISLLLSYLDESPVLVNIRNGAASLSNPLPEMVFPGNTTTVPRRQKSIIPVTVHYDWSMPDGSLVPVSRVVMRGVQVAFEEKNNGTILYPMFRVSDQSLELGKLWIDYNFTREKVSRSRASLGLIHFPVPAGSVVLSVLKVLQDLNATLPVCMSLGSTALSSPKDYPLFVRPRTSDLYTARVFATVIKYFGWKRVAVLYDEENGDKQEMYQAFLSFAKQFGINITNSEPLRAVTDNLYTGVTKQLNDSLNEIINSNVRILVILHDVLQTIVQGLYSFGVRSRFLLIFYGGLPSYELNSREAKRYKAVVKGALQIIPRTFIGKVGQKVLSELIAVDGENYYSNSCFFYDAAMLYMHATDYLIRMGHDYEDPYEIVKAMRSTHFTGCSGTITIAPGLNDKAEAEYSIMNLKYFEGNDSIVFEDAMYYNPFSVVLFKSVSAFMWPDNSTVFTDTLLSHFDCPFPEEQTRHYSTGVVIGLIVTFSICALTIVVTAFIWRKWWNKRYPLISSKTELSADDLLQMIAVPIEFFQFVSVGPESHQLSNTLSQIIKSTTLQLDDIISATGNIYWYLVKSVFACVGLYAFLCFVKLTQWEKKLEWIPLWSFLMLFANLALPVLSNLLFLPIISVLSKLFLCYHAIGDYLTSSYLNKDCYTFCWTGNHLKYVIGGSIALAMYIPLGVYAKPMWQEAQEQLHIRAQPLSLMMKSIVQVTLVTISNSLKPDHETIQAGLFFALITGHFIFKLKVPQYNYHRCDSCSLNLWDAISTLTVLTFSVCAFVSIQCPSSSLICVIVLASVAAVYIVAGAVIQANVKRFESRFFRRKMNQSPIFHFAFTFGARASQYLDLHYNNSYFTDTETLGRIPRTAIEIMT